MVNIDICSSFNYFFPCAIIETKTQGELMYNIVLYQYIKKRAKEARLVVSYSEIKSKLHQFDYLEPVGIYKLLFLVWKDGFSKSIGASANIPFLIIFSAEWAVQLIINDKEDTINAFRMTLGHELSHKDGDYAFLFWERENKHFIHKRDRKFVSWVTEIHHDFAAAEKMVAYNKEKLLASMKYKIEAKPNNKPGQSHPSWEQRKEYVETGIFNEELIKEIATVTSCTNKELIERVCEYYKPIILL